MILILLFISLITNIILYRSRNFWKGWSDLNRRVCEDYEERYIQFRTYVSKAEGIDKCNEIEGISIKF
jgi:hypothetical protein